MPVSAGWYLIDSKSKTTAQLIQQLAADPDIAQVSGDAIGRPAGPPAIGKPLTHRRFSIVAPNDPGFPDEWGLVNTGQTINGVTGVAGADINVQGAWTSIVPQDIFYDKGIIAIVDSGINYNDPDLVNEIWSAPATYTIQEQGNFYSCAQGSHGFSAVDNQSGCSGQEFGVSDHGTETASIIGAEGDNNTAMTGVLLGSKMISIRVFDQNFTTMETTVQTGIDALLQIMSHFGNAANVKILNLGIEFSGPTPGLEEELQTAANAGVFITTATGDEFKGTADYPAFYRVPGSIAVAGSDQLDEPLFFGPGVGTNAGGQIAAPGRNIEAIPLSGSANFGPIFGGTSASVAFVAGAAGLLLQACPLPPQAVVQTLYNTADQITNLNGVADFGQRLNVGAAVDSCRDASAHGTGTVTESLDGQGTGFNQNSGTISVVVDDLSYVYNWDSYDDTTDTIGQGLADAITAGGYVNAVYSGNGTITLTAVAAGLYTNYSIGEAVTRTCQGRLGDCDPAPQINGTSLTGGTGPGRVP